MSENKTILSTIYDNQDLLLKITSGLNAKIQNKSEALSGALSGMLKDYEHAMKDAIPAIATTLFDFMQDTGKVLDGFLPSTSVSSIIVDYINSLETKAAGSAVVAETNAKIYASSIVEATSTFISGKLGEWTEASGTVASRILDIEEEIGGGGGGGEGLGARVARLETATNISVTSGKPIINSTTSKLDTSYNPVSVASIDVPSGQSNINNVQFIGDCKVTYGENGQIIIRIGENLNSSNWNTTDGKTTGTVSRTASTTENLYPDLLADTNAVNGTAYAVYRNTGTITIKPAGLIHFANNSETYFTATVVLGKSTSSTTYYFGKITGNGTYTAKEGSLDGTEKTGFVLTVSNFADEANKAAGATGYQANVTLTFTAATFIGSNEEDFYITAVNHKNGSEATVIWNNTSKIFFTPDTTTKPAIAGTPTLSVSATTSQVKTRSGVKYLTGGTVTAGVTGITALADPCAVATKVSVVSDNQDWLTAFNGTDSDLTGYNQKSTDTVSFSKDVTGNLKHGQFSDCDIKISAINCNGTTTTAATTENLKLLVDTSSATGTSDTKEVFNDESRRLSDAINETAFDSTVSLVDNDGLQVKNTTLQYPAGNYTDYNNGIGGIDGSEQPNYSSLTGDRYYIRKFTIGGTVNSVTVTLTGTNILACKTANTLSFEMMNKQDTKYGATWQNVTFGQTGAIYVGADSTFSATSATLKITFGNGGAAGSVYFRIVMRDNTCNATITSITVA